MARMSVTDAAARLNVSVDSIRRRIRKGDLPATRDNRGQWWLDLPDDVAPEAPHLSVDERLAPAMLAPPQVPMHKPMQAPDPVLADVLRAQVADLVARLDQAEAREREDRHQLRVEREQLRIERERSATAEDQVHTLRRLLDVELAELRTVLAAMRAASATVQVSMPEEGVRVARQPRRPAWRRLLGL